jgi:hypothetical protein
MRAFPQPPELPRVQLRDPRLGDERLPAPERGAVRRPPHHALVQDVLDPMVQNIAEPRRTPAPILANVVMETDGRVAGCCPCAYGPGPPSPACSGPG